MVDTLFETKATNNDELYCVYCHHNKINGKRYIGQTKQVPEERFGKNGSKYSRCVHFNNAINKYGWDAFDHYIIQDNLTKKEADELEILNIAFYNTTDPKYGYNIQSGGAGLSMPCTKIRKEKLSKIFSGRVYVNNGIINKFIYPEEVDIYIQQGFKLGRYLSPEALQKMSQKGENHPMYNKHPSEETRQKISKKNLGKKMSDEAKRKISETQSGRKLSEETKKKISEANKGKSIRGKKLGQYTLDGKLIHIYKSVAETSNFGYTPKIIYLCCTGKRNKHKGYIWKYI
jgi:group I intron endonuclease